MTRIASMSQSSYSTPARSELALLGWLLMLTALIVAALFVEDDAETDRQSPDAQAVTAVPPEDGPCRGHDLRARMCKVATEGGLTAGLQY